MGSAFFTLIAHHPVVLLPFLTNPLLAYFSFGIQPCTGGKKLPYVEALCWPVFPNCLIFQHILVLARSLLVPG